MSDGLEGAEEGRTSEAQTAWFKEAQGAAEASREGTLMWIIMTKVVPTDPVVPKLSVHWSVPWPRDANILQREQLTRNQWIHRGYSKRAYDYDEYDGYPPQHWDREEDDGNSLGRMFGYHLREPDWNNARKINILGSEVRVFPHEFNAMSTDGMRMLIAGGALHLHQQNGVVKEETIDGELAGEQQVIYEEALVAGCDHAQAMMVVFGIDPTIKDAEFPPIGWYSCDPQYAVYFCEAWEADEETSKLFEPEKPRKVRRRRKLAVDMEAAPGVHFILGNSFEGCGHKHKTGIAATKCDRLKMGDHTPGHPRAKYVVHRIEEKKCTRSQ